MNFTNLIAKCMEGDDKSMVELHKQFYPTILKTCLKYSSDSTEAEDYTQDCVLKMFKNLHMFTRTTEAEFGGWLKTLCKNHCIDQHRKKKDVVSDVDINQLIINEDETTLFTDENIKMFYESFKTLSPRYKTVFNMFYFEEYTHSEIDEILGLNPGTSKANLYKAKGKLKKMLKKSSF